MPLFASLFLLSCLLVSNTFHHVHALTSVFTPPPCRFPDAPLLQQAEKQENQENQLLVFTPADYSPFAQTCLRTSSPFFPLASSLSLSSSPSPSLLALQGSDVDMAQRLARTLSASLPFNLTLQFVQSSWADIVQQAVASGFDIGLGGITQTPNRSTYVDFTPELLPGGKVAVALRASRVRSFLSTLGPGPGLSKLASLGLKLVVAVNEGGTNEDAVHASLPNATVFAVQPNGVQYAFIANATANLTLTDAVECEIYAAKTQNDTSAGLWCSSTLVSEAGGVAWMLPKSPSTSTLKASWNRQVDSFVEQELASGSFARTLQDWIQYFGQ